MRGPHASALAAEMVELQALFDWASRYEERETMRGANAPAHAENAVAVHIAPPRPDPAFTRDVGALAETVFEPLSHPRPPAESGPKTNRLVVPTSWNRAGNTARPATRAIVTTPSSRGCRKPSSACRENSGSSSRRSTP